jgi:hypothetical protein
MIAQSNSPAFNLAVARLENTRQNLVAAAGFDQCLIRSAEIAFYQSCVVIAQANGIATDQFVEALKELGMATCFSVPPPPPVGPQSEPVPIIFG